MNTWSGPAPTLFDVIGARRRIAPYVLPTPLYQYPVLTEEVGLDLLLKLENHLPTGAFKVRGGINLMSQLTPDERHAGVIAASTGNHGQSVAYAAHLFDVPATLCVPAGANTAKVASMRALGATVLEGGRDFDEARERCERLAVENGYRYIHSGDEPLLIAGVGTYTLEILEADPAIDVLLVPVGGGSGAAGACIVAKALRPQIEVIGVQAEGAPAGYLSWRAGHLQTAGMTTFAEGLATRSAFALPQEILRSTLDDFILVSDDEIRYAMLLLIERTRNLVEAAGAATLAGALKLRDRLDGKRVVVVVSGGNVTLDQLRALLGVGA